MFFKEYLQKKALKKIERKRVPHYLSVHETKTLCFIINTDEEDILQTVNRLIKILDSRSIKFKAIAINNQKHSYPEEMLDYRIKVISTKNFKYGDIPRKQDVDYFTNESFHILIDFGVQHYFSNEYITKATNALLKIGRNNYQNNPYDLILENKDGNNRRFLNSIIHYLSAIRPI